MQFSVCMLYLPGKCHRVKITRVAKQCKLFLRNLTLKGRDRVAAAGLRTEGVCVHTFTKIHVQGWGTIHNSPTLEITQMPICGNENEGTTTAGNNVDESHEQRVESELPDLAKRKKKYRHPVKLEFQIHEESFLTWVMFHAKWLVTCLKFKFNRASLILSTDLTLNEGNQTKRFPFGENEHWTGHKWHFWGACHGVSWCECWWHGCIHIVNNSSNWKIAVGGFFSMLYYTSIESPICYPSVIYL